MEKKPFQDRYDKFIDMSLGKRKCPFNADELFAEYEHIFGEIRKIYPEGQVQMLENLNVAYGLLLNVISPDHVPTANNSYIASG